MKATTEALLWGGAAAAATLYGTTEFGTTRRQKLGVAGTGAMFSAMSFRSKFWNYGAANAGIVLGALLAFPLKDRKPNGLVPERVETGAEQAKDGVERIGEPGVPPLPAPTGVPGGQVTPLR